MNDLFKLFDAYPAIPIGMMAVIIVIALVRRGRRARASNQTAAPTRTKLAAFVLDQVLFWWTAGRDSFRVRDLLNGGCLILGRAGSGKTSSSGARLQAAIVGHPKSAGLLLAAKPEDAGDIVRIFHKARRLKDLIVFDASRHWRCNFLGCLKRPRDVVTFLTTMSEVLQRGDSKGGGDNSRFYDTQQDRCIYNAAAALQAAREPITAPNLHKFIMTAATTQAQLHTPEWQKKYHAKVLARGFETKLSPLEAHDFQLCVDYWVEEWAGVMDERTRGNILAGVQGVLHTMNTGVVQEMVSGLSNCSPADILDGKWVLVNFPPSTWGAAGQLISAGWKQLVELAVLERKATDSSPFVTVWCDEAQQFVTSGDSHYIAQCRSHEGCLVYLTQSVSSFYAALGKGETGRHQADALLANFSHVIVHASDPVTAKWASSKLGRRKEILRGGSSSPQQDALIWDQMFGNNHTSVSHSEHYEQVLQDQEFMVGRTGGPDNGYLADAIVIKSGEPFSDGQNHQRVCFSQKG